MVGGGAVGVELAGEIMNTFPEKHVTLIHSGTTLVSTNFGPKFSKKVRNQLEQLFDVHIVLGMLTKHFIEII